MEATPCAFPPRLSNIKCVFKECSVKTYDISAKPEHTVCLSLPSLGSACGHRTSLRSCGLLNPSTPTHPPSSSCTVCVWSGTLRKAWPVRANRNLTLSLLLCCSPPPQKKTSFSWLLSSTGRAWQCWRCVRRTTSCKQPSGCSLLSAAEGRRKRDETA